MLQYVQKVQCVLVQQRLHIVFCLFITFFSFLISWHGKTQTFSHVRFKTGAAAKTQTLSLGTPSPLGMSAIFAPLPICLSKRSAHMKRWHQDTFITAILRSWYHDIPKGHQCWFLHMTSRCAFSARRRQARLVIVPLFAQNPHAQNVDIIRHMGWNCNSCEASEGSQCAANWEREPYSEGSPL